MKKGSFGKKYFWNGGWGGESGNRTKKKLLGKQKSVLDEHT